MKIMTASTAARPAYKHSSIKGKSVLLTGVAALLFFPLFAVCRAADAAVKRF